MIWTPEVDNSRPIFSTLPTENLQHHYVLPVVSKLHRSITAHSLLCLTEKLHLSEWGCHTETQQEHSGISGLWTFGTLCARVMLGASSCSLQELCNAVTYRCRCMWKIRNLVPELLLQAWQSSLECECPQALHSKQLLSAPPRSCRKRRPAKQIIHTVNCCILLTSLLVHASPYKPSQNKYDTTFTREFPHTFVIFPFINQSVDQIISEAALWCTLQMKRNTFNNTAKLHISWFLIALNTPHCFFVNSCLCAFLLCLFPLGKKIQLKILKFYWFPNSSHHIRY